MHGQGCVIFAQAAASADEQTVIGTRPGAAKVAAVSYRATVGGCL